MRRIDRIRSMSVGELTDAIIKNDINGNIEFCLHPLERDDYMDEHGEVTYEMCRDCLAKWLIEDEK